MAKSREAVVLEPDEQHARPAVGVANPSPKGRLVILDKSDRDLLLKMTY